jgi:hypothetical protein
MDPELKRRLRVEEWLTANDPERATDRRRQEREWAWWDFLKACGAK